MEKKGVFFKCLSFERIDGETSFKQNAEKVAYFVDKFENDARVVTTWNGVIPGLRYSCMLSKESKEVKDGDFKENFYKLLKFRIWADKLKVVNSDNSVQITLEGKTVDSLTFDLKETTDVDQKVEDLREYFKEKTFQLSTKEEIDKFIGIYRNACQSLYKGYKKQVKVLG